MNIRKKHISFFLLWVALFSSVGIYFYFHPSHHAPSPMTPTYVEAKFPEVSDIPLHTNATGLLIAHQEIHLTPKVNGYVKKIGFHEGEFVKSGTLLIQLDDRKQLNDLAAAKIDAELSELQYTRNRAAYKKGLILQESLYNSKVTHEKNVAKVSASQIAVDDTSLIAPFDGYVGKVGLNAGDYVTPGQTLVTLVNTHQLTVEYSLTSQFASSLKLGQKAVVTADFLSDETFVASVNFISPYLNAETQTIELHAILENHEGKLKPGEFVKVQQPLGVLQNALLVPENSVFASLNGYYVYVLKDSKAMVKTVTLGERIEGKVQIVSGLTPNDKVITKGQNQIKDGETVSVLTSH